MNRPLRISLIVLPWLLLAGVTFVAWLAWVHFQWKDRTLWERMLSDVEAAPAQMEALQLGETAELLEVLEARQASDCRVIREEAHLAPQAMQARVEQALDHCPSNHPGS
ncbi:hypothetical protein [Alkalisalibacterium limincola]|uniref:Uncharacterized protein n=1 Tax=Alkalisalibacterium limincola TaxID=2699169 RepID=A0A5C8KU71_9GAMM|nr:hypothetical protein [Alkalisalibacterium limincola]TXK64411.1 hypothetical protein FU658_05820 [Alkalisalibacterium limincola]